MIRPPLPATLGLAMFLLTACGPKERDSAAEADISIETAAVQTNDKIDARGDGMTAIDAATGDADAMPADWDGPTAYDLRRKEAASPAKKPRDEEPGNGAASASPPEADSAPAAE